MEILSKSPNIPPNSQESNQQFVSSSQSNNTSLPITETSSSLPPKNPVWFKFFIVAAAIVALLSFLFLAWWLYQSFGQTKTISTPSSDRSITTSERFSNTVDDLKTYTSQQCQYQISYPASWQIYTDAEQEDLASVLIASSPVQSETVSNNEVRVQIGCSLVDSNLAPRSIIDDLNSRYQGKGFTISSIQQTSISGKTAYYQTVSSAHSGSLKEYYIFPTTDRVVIANIIPLNSTQTSTAESIITQTVFFE